jgi:hypothetical protein
MKKVNIFKAQRVDQVVMSTMILINTEIATYPDKDLDYARDLFTNEAEILFAALQYSLPGGTLSALFARMCEHYRNLFVVR